MFSLNWVFLNFCYKLKFTNGAENIATILASVNNVAVQVSLYQGVYMHLYLLSLSNLLVNGVVPELLCYYS